ncbi:FeoC-like transcriptional regulator [Candidatus Albibeggiatoa sp. nov. NOAA]|uniref:FeoC-like transcriptional regulator n=1 Tax=Candidatus Albibeggiatoa sp. nov. NOAA TaxID=3162724 RepID=UPI0032F76A47|nr:FeoC-like transcriptional regulator [Thiotrichaceae bacterium]
MDLRQIKAYLIERKQATLTDLAHHFRTEPEMVQGMLTHWVRKGKVQHTHIEACSKGCCHTEHDLDIYRWVEGEPLQASIDIPVCSSH